MKFETNVYHNISPPPPPHPHKLAVAKLNLRRIPVEVYEFYIFFRLNIHPESLIKVNLDLFLSSLRYGFYHWW